MSDETSHGLYIDDSGTKEYCAPDGTYGDGNTRYFVFGGLLIGRDEARNLSSELKALKRETFGTAEVEIKSVWLRNPSKRRSRYLEAFGLTEDQLRSFVEAWYETLRPREFRFIAGVVDKVQMCEDYGKHWYPPAVAYDLVLQRAEMEMRECTGTFSVTIDDMSGATPKKNQYKDNLKRQHVVLRQYGSRLRNGLAMTTLRSDVKFMDSAHSELIQVADVITMVTSVPTPSYGGSDSFGKRLPTGAHPQATRAR